MENFSIFYPVIWLDLCRLDNYPHFSTSYPQESPRYPQFFPYPAYDISDHHRYTS